MMKVSWKTVAVFMLLAISLVFSGCGGKSAPPKGKAKEKAEKAEAAKPEPEVDTAKLSFRVEKEIFNYDPKGRRDPFVPLIKEEKTSKAKKGATPMESFDVEEIKLLAIAWDSQKYYALIQLPDNKAYTLVKGMTLGLYGGRVEEITENAVLIREKITDYKGEVKTKDKILSLRKEEGE